MEEKLQYRDCCSLLYCRSEVKVRARLLSCVPIGGLVGGTYPMKIECCVVYSDVAKLFTAEVKLVLMTSSFNWYCALKLWLFVCTAEK